MCENCICIADMGGDKIWLKQEGGWDEEWNWEETGQWMGYYDPWVLTQWNRGELEFWQKCLNILRVLTY